MLNSLLNALIPRNRKAHVPDSVQTDQHLPAAARYSRRNSTGYRNSTNKHQRRQSWSSAVGCANNGKIVHRSGRSTASQVVDRAPRARRRSSHGPATNNTETPVRHLKTSHCLSRQQSCTAIMKTVSRAKEVAKSPHHKKRISHTAPHQLSDKKARAQAHGAPRSTKHASCCNNYHVAVQNLGKKSKPKGQASSSSTTFPQSPKAKNRTHRGQSKGTNSSPQTSPKRHESLNQSLHQRNTMEKGAGRAKHSSSEHMTAATSPGQKCRSTGHAARRQSYGGLIVAEPSQNVPKHAKAASPQRRARQLSASSREQNRAITSVTSPVRKMRGSFQVGYSAMSSQKGFPGLKQTPSPKRNTSQSSTGAPFYPTRSSHCPSQKRGIADNDESTWNLSPSLHSTGTAPSKLGAIHSSHSVQSISGGSFYEESLAMAPDDEDNDFEYVWNGSAVVPQQVVPTLESPLLTEFKTIPFTGYDYEAVYSSLQSKQKGGASSDRGVQKPPSSLDASPTSKTSVSSGDSSVLAAALASGVVHETNQDTSDALEEWLGGGVVKYDPNVVIPRIRFSAQRKVSMV